MIEVKFLNKPDNGTDAHIIPVAKDCTPHIPDGVISGGALTFLERAISRSKHFKAKAGQSLCVPLPGDGDPAYAVLFGYEADTEKDESLTPLISYEHTGGKLVSAIKAYQIREANLIIDKTIKADDPADFAARIAAGMSLRQYDFLKYKGADKDNDEDQDKTLKLLNITGDSYEACKKAFEPLKNTLSGIFLARDLVNEPPNELYPESYAKLIKSELKPLGVEIDILDEKKMSKLGMGGILAVGMGSARKPRLVVMRWNGSRKAGQKPVALVGKGVTFDTGGISIKPGPGMDEMKMDMGGSAAVCGAMKAVALNKAKANVVGIIGLSENMPSSDAYRPGDIIKSYSGKTVEILNTDAEGRLVLADCMTYVQKNYDPALMVDLATLTGAMMVALGHEYCGTFVNDDKLWQALNAGGREGGEKLWRMPLDPFWKKDMESTVADLRNIAKSGGRLAGACTAAGFLEHFVDEKRRWAHLDIAGTAWIKSEKPTVPKHGTGFGVRILEYLAVHGAD